MAQQDYVYGDWIDSSGAVYPVKFKKNGENIYFLRKRVKYSYRVITLYFHTKRALSTATCNIEERRTAQDTLDFVQTLIMNI